MNDVVQRLETCLDLFGRGELAEADLRAALESASAGAAQKPRQSLLYLSSYEDSVFSGLAACAMIANGGRVNVGTHPHQWPFGNVADAMNQGWRVIKFPDFPKDEERTVGLGCEWILEKWGVD